MISSRFQVLIAVSLLCATALLRGATPEDFFHKGATNYVYGNMKQAKLVVETGLTNFPGNKLLTDLEALLKQNDKQNQGDSKDDQKDQKDKKDQSKQDQQSKSDKDKTEQQKQQEQKQDSQKQEDKQQKPDSSKEKDQADSKKGDQSKGGSEEDQQGQPQKGVLARMTPKEAQQLLDAQKSDEKAMIFIPKPRTNRTDRVFKDW